MPIAGHTTTVSVYESTLGGTSPSSGDYTEVDGINSLSFGPTRDQLESTDFADTTGARTRFSGLKDGTVSISGDYEAGDAGQTSVETIFDGTADATLWVQILWDGTDGHHVECKVESFTIEADVGDKITFSAELTFTGAKATNPA